MNVGPPLFPIRMLVVFWLTLLAEAAAPAQLAGDNPMNDGALVLLEGGSVAEMHRSISDLDGVGVRVLHVFPPRALICSLPASIEPVVVAHRMVRSCDRGLVAVPAEAGPLGNARLGIVAWNRLIAPLPRLELGFEDGGEPLAGDAFTPPAVDPAATPKAAGASVAGSPAPAASQTSEFMVGKIAVGIILPESSGNGENWSSARQDTVIQEITAGCNWWATKGAASAHLTFYYDIHRSVPTQYEPIQRPYYDEALWIPETLGALGYSGNGRFDRCRNYDNALRTQFRSDWGFTIFVVDSLNDSDGKFSDGYFGYAYLGGPFMVMTYDNNGYGIAGMEVVTAHEVGHIFRAMDEYAGTGSATPCEDTNGYLNVKNGNHAYCSAPVDANCIMRGGIRAGLCGFTRGQIGWRNSDGDGIFDPADTSVSVRLSASSPGSANMFTGTATDVAYPSPTLRHCTINTISRAEYRVNSGAWHNALPTDGVFDSADESFSFTPPSVPPGAHMVQVRVWNTVGNFGSQQADVVGSIVHVDRAYSGANADGSVTAPFRTVTTGYQSAQNGDTIRIAGANYPETLTFSKALRVEGTIGIVHIGR